MRNQRNLPKSNKDFPQIVRGILIQRGTSLTHWARKHGFNVKTVFSAVYGQRNGATSQAIVRRLQEEIAP